MQVTIYYFAILKDIKGKGTELIFVKTGLTVGELFGQLFTIDSNAIRFAVNEEFVLRNKILYDGDQVAFIPPLGGG